MAIREILESNKNEPGFATRQGFALGRGLESGGHLFNLLARILGEPQSFQPQSEELRQSLGYTPEQLRPQGGFEGILQRSLESAPTAAAFPIGGIGRTALGTVGGATSGQAAESLGLGPLGQTIATLGGELATRGGIRAIPSVTKEPQKFGGLPQLYKEAESTTKEALASGIKQADVMKFLDEPIKRAEQVYRTGSKATRSALKEVERAIDNGLSKGKMDFSDALDIRRTIDEISKQKDLSKSAFDIMKHYREEINNFLKYYNPANPKFAKSLTKQDKIHQINQMSKSMNQILEGYTKGFYSSKIPAPLSKLLAKGQEIVSRAAIIAKNDPKLLGKYYWKAAISAADRDLPAFANSLSNMNKIIENKYPQKKPTSNIPGKGIFEIL